MFFVILTCSVTSRTQQKVLLKGNIMVHPIEKAFSGEKRESLMMRPNGVLGSVNSCFYILSHLHIVITQHALIYS